MYQANAFFLAIAVGGGAGVLTGLYIFFRRWRQQRVVEDTPAARIRSAAQGYVRLSGCAQAAVGKVLRAPLTGRRCVWWNFRIQERGRGRNSIPWGQNNSGTSDQPFLLADQADHCLIDPEGAEVEPSDRKVWYGNSADDIPPASWVGFLFGFGQKYRYIEAILAEDTQLSVLGELRPAGGSMTNSITDEAAALLSRWKQDQQRLLVRFDGNHDGRIDAAEWETARAAALVEARQNMLQQAPEQRVCVLAKPRDKRPYLIAALSAGQLAHTERWRATAGLALTLLSLIVTCLAIAHVRSVVAGY